MPADLYFVFLLACTQETMDPIFYEFSPEFLTELWYDITRSKKDKDDIYKILIKEKEKISFYENHYDIMSKLLKCHPVNIRPILKRFPFPHLWGRILKKSWSLWIDSYAYNTRVRVGVILLRMRSIRKIKELVIRWYRTMKEGVLIVRNRKDRLPDIRVSIRYHPQMDTYFDVAFSGRFPKDLEDGCFVIHTKKEGTTQRVVQIYWGIYRVDKKKGRQALVGYLDENKTSVEAFTEAMGSVAALEKYDPTGYFVSLAGEYINDYLKHTIYNRSFKSLERLNLFITRDPVLAEYIWGVNFDTDKKRFALAADLEIATKEQNKFIRSNTIAELRVMLDKKKELLKKRNRTIYDNLPENIWRQIRLAEENYQKALEGTPVGFHGVRYYSSEEMESAHHKVKEAWIRADQWIGRNNKKPKT